MPETMRTKRANLSIRPVGLTLAAMFAATFAAMLVAASASGAVVGHTEAGPPLTAERVRALVPAAQQGAWLEYLRRSQQQMELDRAALAAERQGLQVLPPLVKSSPSARSMPLNRDDAWYRSDEALRTARTIVSFQTPAGGWGKNMDMTGPERVRGQSYVGNNENRFSAPGDLDQPRDAAWHYVGTLDNDATTTEIRFLVKVALHASGDERGAFRASALKGLRYLLAAQYPNGGWPQVWPLEGGYHDATTFNDDAVRNAVEVLQLAADGRGEWSFVPAEVRTQAAAAVAKAIGCILRSQVRVVGKLTIWGQQHDALTLEPVGARNFEPASLASQESAALIELLRSQPKQTPALRAAEASGVAWLRAHALYGIAVVGGRDTPEGRHTTAQAGAGPLWARYYDLQSGEPVFGDRDKTIHDRMNELSAERRNGYAWYSAAPAAVLK